MVLSRAVKDIFVVAAKRTPFGSLGGKLAKHSATDLIEVASRAAIDSSGIDPKIIDNAVIGLVMQAQPDAIYLAKHAIQRVGMRETSTSIAVAQNCISSFQSIIVASQQIACGDAQIVLTGGTESMTQVPHSLHGIRSGTPFGKDLKLIDQLWMGQYDTQVNLAMAITAENLAEKYNITRQECDEYALHSQQRWKAAQDTGVFKDEMAPVTVKTKKGEQLMDFDEHPRPETTLEILSKLPAVFKKGGTVTAGNASGVSDGAGCVILASSDACEKHSLKPLARVAGYAVVGCDPKIMGIAPAPAIRQLLKTTGISLDAIDLVEVNEAFAPQYLAVEKELGLDRSRTNVNGGAIAMGHPIGASGSRIMTHLTYALRRAGKRYAIGSACAGGGQGAAILFENID